MKDSDYLTKVKIDEKLVKHLAWLSRLSISEEKIAQFIPQLQEILEFFNQIDSVDTENIPPTFHAIKLQNVFRKDVPHKGMTVEDTLKNAKSRKEQYFKTKGMGARK